MKKRTSSTRSAAVLAAVAAAAVGPLLARAGTSTNTAGPVQQGQSDGAASGTPSLNNAAVTISFSGQTALRTYNTSGFNTLLQPGTQITLHNGGASGVAPVIYYAPGATNGAATVQLGRTSFLTADSNVGATNTASAASNQQHSAIRTEWQEKGSLDGFYDLINDQIGYTAAAGPVALATSRGPSISNPVWVNNFGFTGTNGADVSLPSGAAKSSGGHVLSNGSGAAFYDTYKNNASFGAAQVYDATTGRNLQGGQNRIQFAVGENSRENFSYAGTPGAFLKPGDPGYGQGNPALTAGGMISGLGTANSRQSFYSTSIANQSTDKADPQSAAGATYAAGPWNTAGTANITSTPIAVTAVTISANPGTGLERLNLKDAQWIQTVGRLANGADFNTVSRVANTGQRNVLAAATGIDPTWAVGENDGGDTTQTGNANAQSNVGGALRFAGKTSGTFSRNAISQSRMGVGALSLAENRGASQLAPVRALDIDFAHDTFAAEGTFTRLQYSTFIDFTYKPVLVSHYNTVKAPNAAFAGASAAQWANLTSAQTGIKGDPYGDVAAFIANITGSESSLVSGTPVASISTPADGLLNKGYFLPGLMSKKRVYTGQPGVLDDNPLTQAQLDLRTYISQAYPEIFTAEQTPGATVYGTHDQTIGSGAYYGSQNNFGGLTALTINGGTSSVAITAKTFNGTSYVAAANKVATPYGNYLFGNFNQDGRRDFASVKESLNAALSLYKTDTQNNTVAATNGIYTSDGGVSNATVVTSIAPSVNAPWTASANTKGDLIILGDYNGDGRFDGRDVLLLARGASLADSASAEHLTAASGATFADQIRNPSAVLRKNDALKYVRDNTADVNDPGQTFLRRTALSPQAQANDAANNYLNAFNKLDVDHNGKIDRNDAAIVDKFAGKDYRNLDHQLAATINDPYAATNQSAASGPQVAFNLVDANLTDGKSVVDRTDFEQVRAALGAKLAGGDATFDGTVDFNDLVHLAQNYNVLTGDRRWSDGDFTGDGNVDFNDLVPLAQNYNTSLPGEPAPGAAAAAFEADFARALSAVPEPSTSVALLVLAVGGAATRRRRRRSARATDQA